MANQRNPFRFRLPWAAPAPVAAAPRQGAAPAPAPSRPPFRPPGAAPAQPPPRAELSAPPPTTTQPEGGSKPASPKTRKQSSPATPPKTAQPPGSPAAKEPPATTTPPQLPRSPPQATTTSPRPPRSPPSPQSTTTSPRLPRSPLPPQAATTSLRPPRSPPSPQATATTSPRLPRSPPSPQSLTNASESDAKPRDDLKPILESETNPKESEEVKRILDEPTRKQHRGPEASRKPAKTSIPSHPKPGARKHYPGGCGSEAHSPKEIKGDISRFLNKLGTGQANQTLDGNRQMTIITLAGENRGASMTLGNESKQRESSIHIYRGYKTNPDESSEESSHEEGRKKPGDSKTDENSRAYMNSNVQGVNNSLVFNGSVSTRNPGVQYVLYRSFVEHADGRYEMRKAEFNASSSEKLAYAPDVRRRCLRSLLMESSDSDADNPGKPRRHGCRYDCRKKNKDGSPGVL